MKIFLVDFQDNYSDEYDVEGYFVAEAETLEGLKADIFASIEDCWGDQPSYSWGGNDTIYYDSVEQAASKYSYRELTLDEAKVVAKFFGTWGAGQHGPADIECWEAPI